MRILAVLVLAGTLVSCGQSETDGYSESVPYIPVAEANSEPEMPSPPAPPPTPSHYYDEQDGVLYSYIAAVSEDDRKAGKAAGSVVTFAYMGEEGGRHKLARVGSDGSVIGYSYCKRPCRVITYDDGTQIGYNERSIIGAAFADALRGELQVASLVRLTSPPIAPPLTAPATPEVLASAAAKPLTSQERDLMNSWGDANKRCRGGGDPALVSLACRERDEVLGPQLAVANICFGRMYQPEAENELHRCSDDSLRLD